MPSFTTTPPAPPTSADAAAREMLRILPLLHHTVSALSLLSHEVRDLRPALQDHQDATISELCQRLALVIKRMTPPPPPAAEATASGEKQRDDISCHCVGSQGPNPDCGACGGSGCVSGFVGSTASGSGDLGTLSAGATQGIWGVENTAITTLPAGIGTGIAKECGMHDNWPNNRAFIVALVNAYRSGRLIEAPTPDLGAQGEPAAWAVSRWQAEVANRPLRNVHRRALDTTWRQVIRRFGGDPDTLVGPSHDDLVNAAPATPRTGSGVSGEADPA